MKLVKGPSLGVKADKTFINSIFLDDKTTIISSPTAKAERLPRPQSQPTIKPRKPIRKFLLADASVLLVLISVIVYIFSGGVKSDAETICDMLNKMVEAQNSNDQAKIEATTKEYEPIMNDLQNKYPKGSPEEKELEELLKPCLEEAMKKLNK